MLLWVMGVGFDNTFTVSGKWNGYSNTLGMSIGNLKTLPIGGGTWCCGYKCGVESYG